jgi:ribosome-associated heat shock protein Hsp15
MRIDKYIWAIRIFKTRSMATNACNSDKVKLNGELVKPSKLIKQNDIISIKLVPIWKSFKIIDLPKSRIGPKLVSDYTIETTTKRDIAIIEQHEIMKRQNRSLGIIGRPTKKDRRNLGNYLIK